MTLTTLDEFLQPLAASSETLLELSRALAATFVTLSAESVDQFLPTPISESVLRPERRDYGRFLAIDIGGSNLRVGFVELLDKPVLGSARQGPGPSRQLNRLLEQSWPIRENLKNGNSDSLFAWIGERVAHVVRMGCEAWSLAPDSELPMGVTFSFPMQQKSLAEATLMPMGKGFAVTSKQDLGGQLARGYETHRTADMPPVRIAAIANDAVATLVSFVYQFPAQAGQRASMSLIVGTGCNATIPLKLSSLHESKRPASISVLPGQDIAHVRIAVNTEWSIRGSAPPLRKLGLISRWDTELDQAGEIPGFQPLEYMTAGRYLGELARLIFVDYYTTALRLPIGALPRKLQQRFGLTTTFISHLYPGSKKGPMQQQLKQEFPPEDPSFHWTLDLAETLYRISRAIEVRAAGIIAASTVGLLRCAGEIPDAVPTGGVTVLAVGYTGGCIEHFQNYLADTKSFIDDILDLEFAGQPPARVVLTPCHDGGITGAGILVPAALASYST
ncbi:actin-like ATPase domain-containing protein [Trichocladium antarcticum]|uniref:Phosphotransferase n=1 Tax=Trichocladium antarcticum TaxID=1450529 RepID=A0AAN6ZD46_9PEZI|nr:actin-like ATPase domain-containing protein [Trichocladium antarcticum]